jgi:hypothetical protein
MFEKELIDGLREAAADIERHDEMVSYSVADALYALADRLERSLASAAPRE